jgi:DNA primase
MPIEEDKISKVEETLILTLIEYPDCLEYDELSELLDFMGSDRVKDYILRLRELIFEIDIKEFKNFALNIAKDFNLESLASKAIGKYTGMKLEKEKAKKMIVDLEKKLIKDQLRDKKAELRIKRDNIRTEEELTSLMVEIHKIEKKLYSLK